MEIHFEYGPQIFIRHLNIPKKKYFCIFRPTVPSNKLPVSDTLKIACWLHSRQQFVAFYFTFTFVLP